MAIRESFIRVFGQSAFDAMARCAHDLALTHQRALLANGWREKLAVRLQFGRDHMVFTGTTWALMMLMILGGLMLPKPISTMVAWSLVLSNIAGFVWFAADFRFLRQNSSARYMSWAFIMGVVSTLMALPAIAQAQTVKCKSLADNCGALTAGPAVKMPTQGYQRVGASNVYIIGKTADGKYNVYDLQVPAEGLYLKDNTKYSENQVLDLLAAVDKTDVDTKLNCDFGVVCKTRAGQVVGVVPAYKALREKELAGKKKVQ